MATIYKSGDKKQIICPVDGSVAIAKGDLLQLSSGVVYPISVMGDSGSKLQNQQAAAAVFIGVAGRAKAADGVAGTIPVYTGGIFEFAATSATYAVGSLVGPQGTGAASAVGVSSTDLEAVATATASIGKVARKATTATRVQVRITPVSMEMQPNLYSLAGSGGAVTQTTSASTPVTLNKLAGVITTVPLTTGVGAEEVFTCNNELVAANDVVVLNLQYSGAGTLIAVCKRVQAGSFEVGITNLHGATVANAAAAINFIVFKGANS